MGNSLAHITPASRTAVIGLLLILIGSTVGHAQRVTIRGKGITLPEVFGQIERQTSYVFFYSTTVLRNAPTFDLDFRQKDIRMVLDSCFAGTQLYYRVLDRTFLIYKGNSRFGPYKPLEGKVLTEDGEPLEYATLSIDGVLTGMTKADGSFQLAVKKPTVDLTVSYVGFSSRTISCPNTKPQTILLKHISEIPAISIYSGYNALVRNYPTGSWETTSATLVRRAFRTNLLDSIGRPPRNFLAMLMGKVTGLTIRQYNGVPGSNYGLLIRGRASISQNTDPIVIVDGVPVALNDGGLGRIGSGSAQGVAGASALNGIPSAAIEKIEILKDAAAMADYGVQSSNGVIIITLKKGSPGRPLWNAEISSGIDQPVKTAPLLDTRQYLNLRKEALLNDGLPVSKTTLPEYFLWDTTRSKDYKKTVIGNTRLISNAHISVTGGSQQTNFLMEGNISRGSSLFPGSTGDHFLSFYGQLRHTAFDNRLRLDASLLCSDDNNQLPIQDYSNTMFLAPNAPAFLDSTGALVWTNKGLAFQNIPALQHNDYRADVFSFLPHFQLSYQLLPGLRFSASLAYLDRQSHEYSQQLLAGQAPALNAVASKYDAGKTSQNLQTQTQLNYSAQLGPGQLTLLAGFSHQNQQVGYHSTAAVGYATDQLLATGGGNPLITRDGGKIDYTYHSLFSSINYILQKQYVFSLSGRRDVSSRFGPGNQGGNFWTTGMAWLFSKQQFFTRHKWLSIGRLWGNYGTSGNDQIGDGSLNPQWASNASPRTYKGLQSPYPVASTSPGNTWELNYNTTLGLDLGFLEDNLLVSVVAYKDWTTNQLIINAPPQTGLPTTFTNLPVTIVNKGLELSLQYTTFRNTDFTWKSTLTLTIPGNRLTRFPQLAATPYANTLVAGQSLSVVKGYRYTGVNPTTGLFQFQDINNDGQLDQHDKVAGRNLDPRCYGGLDQSFDYRQWHLYLTLDLWMQDGVNPYALLYQNNPPGFLKGGTMGNGPVGWLDHWRQPGDKTSLQRLTTTTNSEAARAIGYYLNSTALLTDASYIRLRTLMVSYHLPHHTISNWRLNNALIYLKGQNLLTLTHYPVTDPETQNPFVLPPTRTIMLGIKLGF